MNFEKETQLLEAMLGEAPVTAENMRESCGGGGFCIYINGKSIVLGSKGVLYIVPRMDNGDFKRFNKDCALFAAMMTGDDDVTSDSMKLVKSQLNPIVNDGAILGGIIDGGNYKLAMKMTATQIVHANDELRSKPSLKKLIDEDNAKFKKSMH